jgi:competence protein ComFC
LEEPFCEVCGEAYHGRIDSGFSCPNCSGVRFSFEFVRPSLVRDDRVLSMVRRLKYGRELHLAAGLGRLAGGAFRDPRLADALEGRWPLVPVPLHRARFRRRHFNQSEEIARGLSVVTGLPMVPAMERIRDTGTQTLLGRRKRMENLRGAFRVRDELRDMAAGAGGVVLVDDVLTTGSTLHECAKELRKAGFRRVVGVTVMRG